MALKFLPFRSLSLTSTPCKSSVICLAIVLTYVDGGGIGLDVQVLPKSAKPESYAGTSRLLPWKT